MRITLYGLANCDSCRKARTQLRQAGHTVILRDVRAEPLAPDEIERLLEAFGPDLVNRRSATWRGLDPSAREMAPAGLLGAHPALMKRPIIEADGRLWLGWDNGARAALA